MPQFTLDFIFSQFFWLICSFGVIYVFIAKFFVPKIENQHQKKHMYVQNISKQMEDMQKKINFLSNNYRDEIGKAQEIKNKTIERAKNLAFEAMENKKNILQQRLLEQEVALIETLSQEKQRKLKNINWEKLLQHILN